MECVRMGGIFHDFSVEEGGFPELSRSVFSGRITVSGKIELFIYQHLPSDLFRIGDPTMAPT